MNRFGSQAGKQIHELVPDSMIRDFWPLVCERGEANSNLGRCLAQARHLWEGRWGLQTLEIPLSYTCQFEAFHWFVAHLLAQLPRFWTIYNEGIVEYRHLNRIRSKHHPVPELADAVPNDQQQERY